MFVNTSFVVVEGMKETADVRDKKWGWRMRSFSVLLGRMKKVGTCSVLKEARKHNTEAGALYRRIIFE